MVHLLLDRMPSPLGTILLVHDGESRLRALDFEDYAGRMHQLLRLHYGAVTLAQAAAPAALAGALAAYFAGAHAALADVRVATGGTPFQRAVWAALRTIPPGTTTTYGALARAIGRPAAFRAVGMANGANPVAIVVPCHRVIGADSGLTGFGGGLHRKRWLLEHEGVAARPDRTASARRHPATP